MADQKLSELAVVPGSLPLTGDYVYTIRGDGNSPEAFVGYKVDIATFLGGANNTDYEESVLIGTDQSDGNIVLSGNYTLQGVALVDGNRVLATAQSTGANNRVWVVAAGAWTIAEGWDVADTVTGGKIVPIEAGDNAGKKFQLLTTGAIVLGTTVLSWDTDTPVAISNFTGINRNQTSLTLAVSWAKTWNFMDRAGVQTVTIPTHATAAIVIGSEIVIQHDGTGVKTVACVSSSVSLNGVANGSLTLSNRGDAYLLKKKANNVWTATPLMAVGATAAEYRTGTAAKAPTIDQIWAAAAEVALTDAATIAVNLATFINASVTLGGNRTLGQPSNLKPGQTGYIRITQDGTGSRTLAYHADWVFAGGTDPVLTTTASAYDLLFYQVLGNSKVFASLTKGIA